MLSLSELFVSSMVHMLYGFYIFSTAVASDISQGLYECFRPMKTNVVVKEEKESKAVNVNLDGLPPIVLVHGIFGFGQGRLGGMSYFAGAEKKDERVLVPDLGSLTSIYDRARELFYYLKGGRVDYGEEHSKAYGHSRFGRIYEQGHYPEWDEHRPIHFVGHSAGAQVVRMLQQMLADKAFAGYDNTSESWVLSLTSLSGALNGTTRTYFDGMQPEDGRSMKRICLLQLCRLGVIMYDWLDIPLLKKYYNFGFDHFTISRTKAGVCGLIDCLLGNEGPFASGDWILPTLPFKVHCRLMRSSTPFQTHSTSVMPQSGLGSSWGSQFPLAYLESTHCFSLRVLQMSQWRYPSDVLPPFKGYRDEDWQDNDGAVNTTSMTHPWFPVEHPSHLVIHDSECQPLKPGIWYYKIVEADHILFIVNRERAGVQFDLIYDSIFERCRKHAFRKALPTLPNESPSQLTYQVKTRR